MVNPALARMIMVDKNDNDHIVHKYSGGPHGNFGHVQVEDLSLIVHKPHT